MRSQIDNSHAFACKLCAVPARKPVAALCGHLFCWSCFCQRAGTANSFECPVCFQLVSSSNLTTVYLRQQQQQQPDNLPPRPTPQRLTVQNNPSALANNIVEEYRTNLHQGKILAGYGYFPCLFSLARQFFLEMTGDIDLPQDQIQHLPSARRLVNSLLLIACLMVIFT